MRDATEFGPLHRGLPRHRKLRRLSRMLDIPKWQAVGIVSTMWCECLLLEPDGVLDGWTDEDFADALEWEGSPQALIESLISSGWLHRDGECLRIHGVEDYYPLARKLKKTIGNRERKRQQRSRSVTLGHTESRDVTLWPARREEKRREEKTPTGGTGGAADADTPARKARSPQPSLTFDDLLGMPFGDHEDALASFRAMFPAFDGQNGRPSLEDKLGRIREWWEAQRGKKRWRTPRGIHEWLAKDYQGVRWSWEKDQRSGRGGDSGADWWESTQRGLAEVGNG